MSSSARRRSSLVAAMTLALIAGVWALWPEPTKKDPAPVVIEPPAAQTIVAGTRMKPAVCGNPATKPFVPTRITVPGVTTNANVQALPRDAANVPSAPALGSAGAKVDFAWDAPTVKPGEKHGNVLINAHTWPDGTSLGNHLLDKFQVGDVIIVNGRYSELCYRVTKRDVIVADEGSYEYYGRKDGPPQLALIVCSPPRLGPGHWVHRTIWYASPMKAGDTGA